MLFFAKFGFVLFAIFSVADVTLMAYDLDGYRYFTKPFLLPLLIAIIFSNALSQKHPVSKAYLFIALFAGTIGDILLLNEKFFISGLVGFLVMQLFYSLYFFRMQKIKKEFIVTNTFIALVLAGFGFILVGSLYKFMGDLKVPVIIYSLVLLIMLFAAINIYNSKRAQKLAIRFFIPGAAMLVMSDTILAINKFYLKDNLYEISVMVTYILGQYFLSMGFIKHLKSSRGKHHHSGHSSVDPLVTTE